MPRILVTASYSPWLLGRQTPGCSGRWDEFEFIFEATDEPVDGWVVMDNLQQPLTQLCPPENTLLITGEPESVRRYRSRYTGQFAQVWTSQRSIRHRHSTLRNEAQHWHYAMNPGIAHDQKLDFDGLVNLQRPIKPKMASVICSSKAVTPDHRRRLDFVRLLQARLGSDIDVFGRGIRAMDDKSEAIWPYKYHIVLENDHSDYFMTEKISDAYLGWSYPIYFGGKEAYHRFPDGAFTAIDIYQPEQAISIIRSVLASATYEDTQAETATARRAVLQQNNLFAMLADYWRSNRVNRPAKRTTLLPKSHRGSLIMQQMLRTAGRPFTRQAA